MTYPQMEEEFISYLGDRYCADDWKDAHDTLFSADDLNDDATPLMNLQALYAKHVPQASSLSNIIAYVYDSKQSDNFVMILNPPWDFPYPVSEKSAALKVIGYLF
ncbi:hypothetical protein CY34DRAFT_18019 [Suillus luteus UH-Slu-Lm8-n1]|uniref:Uncharacterized protein n=1 Tax=Suillus luteus UH-Slu-Lm8-n1 TaxID=930992 RepID=A0A0D0AIG9_9AGAM|nr:hypothetical protein CY34DRAFT_18019 [Suillus luteus UH-Slu-Lm8-n1]